MKNIFISGFCRATVIFLLAGLMLSGCSGNAGNPVEPVDAVDIEATREAASGHKIWGIWNIGFDPATYEITVTPLRTADTHYAITDWLLPPDCDDCLAIHVNSFDPVTRILDADVTLRNPTVVNVYDVRGILYTNEYGHELRNADAWTALWDMLGGQDINPFRAFAKGQPKRLFAGDASHTENYLVYFPIPPHWNDITFAVDISWPGNCKEPYAIEDFMQYGDLYDDPGSQVIVSVHVLDWQFDQSEVLLHAQALTGQETTALTKENYYTWNGTLANAESLGAGEYEFLLSAASSDSGGLLLYQYVEITVSGGPHPTLTDVTPPWLNLEPRQVCVEGNYLYVGAGHNGLHIYDITDPVHPLWVNSVELPDRISDIDVEGSYAYAITFQYTVNIIDIDPPESAHVVGSFEAPLYPTGINVSGNYAYIIDDGVGLRIFDVSTPESAFLITTVDTQSWAHEVAVSDGYAYVADTGEGLLVIDIDPPESAHMVQQAKLPYSNCAYGVAVSGDYAYVADYQHGLVIVDITSPESAFAENVVYTPDCERVTVFGNYAFLTGEETGLHIVDIGAAKLVNSIATPGTALECAVADGYAYLADGNGGLHVVDVASPESAKVISVLETPDDVRDMDLSGSLVYSALGEAGLGVIDISTPGSEDFVNVVPTPSGASHVALWDSYACVSGEESMYIIDVDTPGSEYIAGSVGLPGLAVCLGAADGYAYASIYLFDTIQVIDIDPPETAEVVGSLEMSTTMNDIEIQGNYVYAAHADDFRLSIIDINVPEAPSVVHTVDLEAKPRCMLIKDNIALVGLEYGWLELVDISIPESAHVIKEFSLMDGENVIGISMIEGYLIAAAHNGCIDIIDVDPVEAMHVENTIYLSGPAGGLCAAGGYAYGGVQKEGVVTMELLPGSTGDIVNTIQSPAYTNELNILDDKAYIASLDAGMKVYDISDPQSPQHLKSLDIPAVTYSVFPTGEYAYIGARHKGLQIVDISPLDSAYIINSVDTTNWAYVVGVKDGYAYVLTSGGELEIIDIDPPGSAHSVFDLGAGLHAFDLAFAGDYLCVAIADGCALRIFDITDPEDASYVGGLYGTGDSYGIDIQGQYAYLAGGDDGLNIVDISDPEQPELINTLDTPGFAYGVTVFGDYAIVADGEAGVQLCLINPLDSAHIVASADTPGNAQNVVVYDGHVYISDYWCGLHIFRID